MDLYQIRYFLAIVETGNFSRASERLFVSQPSLSTGIKKLEKELGVSLFERGGRRTVPTAAGRAFLAKATVIMEQYESALHELKGFDEQPTLRLGVLSTMRVAALATLVSTFQQHHPHVTVELHDGSLESLRTGLERGDIDVALTVLSMRTGCKTLVQDDSQVSTVLFQQPLLLAVPQSHPFAQRGSIRLADLEGQPVIDRINCEFFEAECRVLEDAKVRPKVVYRASHEEWVISLLRAGLGISIMPRWQGLAGIVYLPVMDLELQRTIGVKWRQHQTSEIVEQFCHFAASHDWNAAES